MTDPKPWVRNGIRYSDEQRATFPSVKAYYLPREFWGLSREAVVLDYLAENWSEVLDPVSRGAVAAGILNAMAAYEAERAREAVI